MSILIGSEDRILVQGITGTTGAMFARRMLAGGTPVVGGVTPGRGGMSVEGLPVFDTVAEAVRETKATAVLSCIPPRAIEDGLYEVVDAGIPLAVLYIENIPIHDAIRMCAYGDAHGTRILGPNSAGVITPGQANMSDLNDANVTPGRIGIVSKSGTLTYEVIDELRAVGHAVSTVVCLGGDRVIGTDYVDVLALFEDDPDTDAVVLVGEPGGTLEYRAGEFALSMRTPVAAYITGQGSPPESRMGHAGAVIGTDGLSSPQAKIEHLKRSGIAVAAKVTDVGRLVHETVSGQ